MAFLGDFGKIFLGGASTGQVVTAATGNPIYGVAAQRGADLISKVNIPRASSVIGGATAVSEAQQTVPQETGMSGTGREFLGFSDEMGGGFESVYSAPQARPSGMQVQQAGLPAVIGGGLAAGRGLYGMLFGGAAGIAAPMIIDQLTGQPKKLRVTRKLQRDVKQAVMLLGPEVVANQLGVGVDIVVFIMQKKIRNDGPFVTRAAVRKTRSTVRKMKSICDLYEDLRPAAKRRSPVRRTPTTKVMNYGGVK
jgi:hypothetical protein